LLSTDELVRLADEAELRGDNAAREQLIQRAIKQGRGHSAARWHAGHVRDGNRWKTLEDYAADTNESIVLRRYRENRAVCFQQMPLEQAHIVMARWCRQKNLAQRERFHWLMVLERTPDQPEALAALKLTWADGRLWTPDELRQSRETQRASQQWSKRIAKLVERIERDPNSPQAHAALEQLRAIDDPAAIEGLLTEAATRSERLRLEVVAVLGRMNHHEAAGGLVSLSLGRNPFPAAYDEARAQLRRRPLAQTAPFLLACLHWPVELEQEFLASPSTLEYNTRIITEGPNARYIRESSRTMNYHPNTLRSDTFRRRYLRYLQLRPSVAARYQRRAEWDRMRTELANQSSEAVNRIVTELLSELSGEEVPTDPQACVEWWCDYNEVSRNGEKPVLRGERSVNRFVAGGQAYEIPFILSYSCFPRGTPVWTEIGLRPIEQLQPGDLVLSQDLDSGELTFKSVLQTTEREPAPVVRIRANDEDLTTTRGHPFWQTGRGWRMAKFLSAGDSLHGLHGSWPVQNVKELAPQPAFNLIVDRFHTYFVGRNAFLVHDNTFRRPTAARLPGYHGKQ
jgi:hypothetical protein